jgi:hypothetical protein
VNSVSLPRGVARKYLRELLRAGISPKARPTLGRHAVTVSWEGSAPLPPIAKRRAPREPRPVMVPCSLPGPFPLSTAERLARAIIVRGCKARVLRRGAGFSVLWEEAA